MKYTKIDTQPAELTYLEFVNNFLTVERMAVYYGIDPEYLRGIIETGKIQNRYQRFINYLTSKK